MRYDAPPRRSSLGTVILVVLLLGFVALFGLLVLGVGAFIFSARSHNVNIEFARAQAAAAHARAEAQRAMLDAHAQTQAQTPPQMEDPYGAPSSVSPSGEPAPGAGPTVVFPAGSPYGLPAGEGGATPYGSPAPPPAHSIRIANREVTIQLDEGGKLQFDGADCELPQLNELLRNAGAGRENALVVLVRADKQCPFEHVANVLAVCKELNLNHVRIAQAAD